MLDLGTVRPGATIPIPFATYDSNDPSASVTASNFALADIAIYKDGNIVQRGSTAGFTLLDTDGIDFDGTVGIHGLSINLADNTTANFYEAGSQYWVVVGPITVDAATINFIAATFGIGYPDANLNTTIATLASQVSFTLEEGSADDDAYNGCVALVHDLASATQIAYGYVDDYVGSTKTVTLAIDPAIFTMAAGDNVSIFPPTNVAAISGDSTAADNLELMYDGTGYTDDTAPASRTQVDQIAITGSAVKVPVKSAPDGFVLTTGSEVNDEDSVRALDGIRHELTDAAGVLDGYYKFDIGGDGVPVEVKFTGIFNGNNDSWDIEVNIGSSGTPVWSPRGTITGTNISGNVPHTFDLLLGDIVSDLDEVWIRVNGTGLTSSSFDSDQIFVSKSVVNRSVGYALGAVWIDTVHGEAGTEKYVNGVADEASLTLADAIIIAANLPLHRFQMSPESIITFAESHTDEVWSGDGWTLAFGSQDVSQSHFYHCNDISGIGTTPSGEAHILDSHIGATTLGACHVTRSTFMSTFNGGAAANYFIEDSRSGVAGAGSPTLDFSGNGPSSNINARNWFGGGTWIFDADCTASIEVNQGGTHTVTTGGGDVEFRGNPKALVLTTSLTGTTNIIIGNGAPITINGTGGTVNIYGLHGGITDNSSGTTVTDFGADVTDLAGILEDTAEIGTAGDGLTDITINAASVDNIWDEAMASHNVGGSAGKFLRQIKEGVVSAESTVNDAAATTTSFITALTEASDSHYSDATMAFISGALTGQARIIENYNGTTKEVTFDEAWSEAPADTDSFIILTTHSHTLIQVVTAILDEALSGHTIAGSLAKAIADTEADAQAIESRVPAALVGGLMDSNVGAINASVTAAVQLALSANEIEDGACEGTPTTTVIQTDLAETQDDIYIGRVVIFTSGAARGEASDITDYDGATGTITVTLLANAPAASDTFILI